MTKDNWLQCIDLADLLQKALKLETFSTGWRSHGWDSIPLIPLTKSFKRVIKPSAICQSRKRLSVHTWKKAIWCQFCLQLIKQLYLEPVQNGKKAKANRAGSISLCFFLHVLRAMNDYLVQGHFCSAMLTSSFIYKGYVLFMSKHIYCGSDWANELFTLQTLHSCSFLMQF